MANRMVVIRDLVTLQEFFDHAVRTLGSIDRFTSMSAGEDGILEMQHLYETDVLPGETVCTAQIHETPLADNGGGLTTVTFACTLMISKKIDGGAQLPAAKLAVRNETWKKMIKLVGLLKLASEYYATNTDELTGEAYDVIFRIFQEKLLPLGGTFNAKTEGWLLDVDVTIPINELMYG